MIAKCKSKSQPCSKKQCCKYCDKRTACNKCCKIVKNLTDTSLTNCSNLSCITDNEVILDEQSYDILIKEILLYE